MPPSLLLVGNYLPGAAGASAIGHQLARRLRESGWPVVTCSGRQGRLGRVADMAATIWRRHDEFDVAQVDVFSGPAFVWAEMVCALLDRFGIPFVLTLHGGHLPTFARRFPVRARRLLRAAWAVTTPSEYLRTEMEPYRPDLQVLPNGLEVGAYRFRPRDRADPVLLWLRSFHEIYQPELAPAVLQALHRDYPNARLMMVGPDTGDGSRERTVQLAARLGVLSQMELPGGVPKSEVPVWLDKADVFLNTSRVDNTPVSLLEALVSGLCVVSTDAGGIPYLVTHERDALLSPVGDADRLAAAVHRVLKDAALAGRLSTNGRSNAARFDWSVIMPRWEQLLVAAANSRR
jgi:glycosyltransferase involved in cell wall biosynthesis